MVYLFNGEYWEHIDNNLFKDFLGKIALKNGVIHHRDTQEDKRCSVRGFWHQSNGCFSESQAYGCFRHIDQNGIQFFPSLDSNDLECIHRFYSVNLILAHWDE